MNTKKSAAKAVVLGLLSPRPGLLVALAIIGGGLNPNIALAQAPPAGSDTGISAQDAFQNGKAAFDRKDYAEALRSLSIAAAQGNARAQTMIGMMYENGLGVGQDYGQAATWYLKAANQGEVGGEAAIGRLFFLMDQDKYYRLAMDWLHKAADQGNAEAQYYIGLMYVAGRGVAQDTREGLLWLGKSAAQGNVLAETLLGHLYLGQAGVPIDYGKALTWLTKAAQQGNVDAQVVLGWMYKEGKGVEPDWKTALSWIRKAAAQGDADARKEIPILEGRQVTKRNIPPALAAECILEPRTGVVSALKPGTAEAKQTTAIIAYQECLRSNWKRLFGDRPFPGD